MIQRIISEKRAGALRQSGRSKGRLRIHQSMAAALIGVLRTRTFVAFIVTGLVLSGVWAATSVWAGIAATGTVDIRQAGYRFYNNADSINPGAALAYSNTPATLSSTGDKFRLRTGVNTSSSTKQAMDMATVSTGDNHACGINPDNQLYCWGAGWYGQLGNNTYSTSVMPVPVTTTGVLAGKSALAVAVGSNHSCAIASDNLAYCWGYNNYGQLGNNSITQSAAPVPVDTSGVLAGKTIISITAGASHTCVVASDNAAYCWGYNANGRLGDNTTTQRLVPVAVNTAGVLAGKTVKSIDAGGSHTCAIASDDQAYCWGYNANGRLGDNTTTQRLVPVAVNTAGVLAGKTVLRVSTGENHSCAIASDDQAYCWGANDLGQLGSDTVITSAVPTALYASSPLAGKQVASVSAGLGSTCVASSEPSVYCWGESSFTTSVTDPEANNPRTPVAVDTSGVLAGKTIVSATGGSYHTCTIASDGNAYCWGQGGSGQLGNGIATASAAPVAVDTSGVLAGKTILAIAPGYTHTCAIASDNQAYCWGSNAYGQLGNGTTVSSNTPVAVNMSGALAGKTLLSITSGARHTCVVASDNQAYCWGINNHGELGNNSTAHSSVPVAVNSTGVLAGKTILTVMGGAWFTCSIASDNQVYCWGDNSRGTLGNNTYVGSLVPVAVDTTGVLAGKMANKISAVTWGYTVCITSIDNQAYCWGYGGSGQLGNGQNASSPVPVAVDTTGVLAGKGVIAVAVGYTHTCAIASDNQAYCWGSNANTGLGDGTNVNSAYPVAVNTAGAFAGKTLKSIIGGGEEHTCAIASDDQAYCWGSNRQGQLGIGRFTRRPISVTGQLEISTIPQSLNSFKLQVAQKTASTCSAQPAGFIDVTASTPIAYSSNTNATDRATITQTPNDPLPSVGAVSPQMYVSSNATPFTNNSDIAGSLGAATQGDTGLWDFSLRDNGAPVDTSYCIRMVYADGTPLERYDQISYPYTAFPEIKTAQRAEFSAMPYRFYQNSSSLAHGAPLEVANTSAQLGGQSKEFRLRAGVGANSMTFRSISTGTYSGHTCALGTDNQAYCWGYNSYGQLGNNSTTNSSTPVAVDMSGVLAGKTIEQIAVGDNQSCAIASDNQAYCWGRNSNGQLGNNSTTNSSTPVAVDTSGVLAGKTIKALSSGWRHTCAIASDNQAYCWGGNSDGALGNGATTDSLVPVAVDTSGVLAGKTIKSITATDNPHTCVIASDNQVYCWGSGYAGALGNNTAVNSSIPVAVDTSGVLAGKTIKSISGGGYHTCVVASDNHAYCWGANWSGQLGNGTTVDSAVPVAVDMSGVMLGKDIATIAGGGEHTCALSTDNSIYCWGANWSGQLGNGTTTNSNVPSLIYQNNSLAGRTVDVIAGASSHTCALTSDKSVYCWGENSSGELGNSSTFDSPSPVIVASKSSHINTASSLYRLEYAARTAATCSVQADGFSPITTMTPIAFNNATAGYHGNAIAAVGFDPGASEQTILQSFVSRSDYFTSLNEVPIGHTALWEFSLRDNYALPSTEYCLRLAYSDGSSVGTMSSLPSITTAAAVTEVPIDTVPVSNPVVGGDGSTLQDDTMRKSVLTTVSGECTNINMATIRSVDTSMIDSPQKNVVLVGGIDYELACTATGGSAVVDIALGVYYANIDRLRVYKSSGSDALEDVSDKVSLANKQVNGKTKTVITYRLTDGGSFDEDGDANGVIVDPIYVGIVTPGPPNTGVRPAARATTSYEQEDSAVGPVVVSLGAGLIGAWLLRRQGWV